MRLGTSIDRESRMGRQKKAGLIGTIFRIVVLGSVFGVLLLVVIAVYIGPRVSGKRNAPRSMALPMARSGDAVPILQLEDHTCGFLALSAAYTVYGLSPEAKNLRYRLGVDTAAHPFDATSTGTLHPDLLRVLVQDGFSYALIDPGDDSASDLLTAHLGSANLALVLIKRRETGGLHWVLADGETDGKIRIVDSLAERVYEENIRAYLRESVLSIVADRCTRRTC